MSDFGEPWVGEIGCHETEAWVKVYQNSGTPHKREVARISVEGLWPANGEPSPYDVLSRIIACINACAGIPTDQLPNQLEPEFKTPGVIFERPA